MCYLQQQDQHTNVAAAMSGQGLQDPAQIHWQKKTFAKGKEKAQGCGTKEVPLEGLWGVGPGHPLADQAPGQLGPGPAGRALLLHSDSAGLGPEGPA